VVGVGLLDLLDHAVDSIALLAPGAGVVPVDAPCGEDRDRDERRGVQTHGREAHDPKAGGVFGELLSVAHRGIPFPIE
jgi:hypothetical protein